jgi:hypothetical protein
MENHAQCNDNIVVSFIHNWIQIRAWKQAYCQNWGGGGGVLLKTRVRNGAFYSFQCLLNIYGGWDGQVRGTVLQQALRITEVMEWIQLNLTAQVRWRILLNMVMSVCVS